MSTSQTQATTPFSFNNYVVGVENYFKIEENNGFITKGRKVFAQAVADAGLTVAGTVATLSTAAFFAISALPLYFISYDSYLAVKDCVADLAIASFNAFKGIARFSAQVQVEEVEAEEVPQPAPEVQPSKFEAVVAYLKAGKDKVVDFGSYVFAGGKDKLVNNPRKVVALATLAALATVVYLTGGPSNLPVVGSFYNTAASYAGSAYNTTAGYAGSFFGGIGSLIGSAYNGTTSYVGSFFGNGTNVTLPMNA